MKICIIRLSSLGDIVLLQPVCALLQSAYPSAQITLVCKPQFVELAQMFEPPVTAIAYRKSVGFHLWMMMQRFDLVLDLHGKFASILLKTIIPAPVKLGYHKQRRIRKLVVAGDRTKAIDSTISLYASALKPLGISTAWQPPLFTPIPAPALSESCKPVIGIIPGATHFTKRYPPEQWTAFICLHPDWEFRLFGSDADAGVISAITRVQPDNCIGYAGKLNLRELHRALAQCDLIISGDTGPMHLAATLGKPQIAIFGGTHPRLGFRPLNPLATVLCADLDCQPCSLHGCKTCPLGHFRCMREVTPQLLSESALLALKH